MAAMREPKGLGPQKPTRKFSHWAELLGNLLSRKACFKNFRAYFPIIIFWVRFDGRNGRGC